MQPVVNAMLTPVLSRYLSALPDEGIPQMAHDVVEQMRHRGQVSLLDGAVTLEEEDLDELASLLEKNLPVTPQQGYQVVR